MDDCCYAHKRVPDRDITLIESPNIQITGVGESTTQLIQRWIDWLGIELKDFMPYTDATFKLSVRFQDFYKKERGLSLSFWRY